MDDYTAGIILKGDDSQIGIGRRDDEGGVQTLPPQPPNELTAQEGWLMSSVWGVLRRKIAGSLRIDGMGVVRDERSVGGRRGGFSGCHGGCVEGGNE